MELKDLNHSQLLLLVVLLSFITSIATGITTVTLMQEAPISITSPINRVIQQTVEKIVPAPSNDKPQTVVIKEEDLVVDAIAKNKSALFAVSKDFRDPTSNTLTEISIGQGFAVSADGVVAVDAQWAPGDDSYYVENASGKSKAEFLFTDKGVSYLKIGDSVAGRTAPTAAVPAFGDISKIKAGQRLIVFGDTINSFIFDGTEAVKVNITKSLAGGMVLDLEGEVLGIALSGEGKSFVSANIIQESLTANQ